jgi:hypothetical protein
MKWDEGVKAMSEAKKALFNLSNDDTVFLKRIG